MQNKINPLALEYIKRLMDPECPPDRPAKAFVIHSLEQLVEFCGVKIQKRDRDAVYELFNSAGKNPEKYYQKDNQGRIRIEQGRIVYINANSTGLKTLPNTIGELKALQRLYVSVNQLTSLPDTIGELKALERLYVFSNQLNKKAIALCESLKQSGVTVYY